jgi:enoyl-CoA hydratase/carnithine racemase
VSGETGVAASTAARVRLCVDGPVATIAIDRPEARNAMTFAMWDRLGDLAREVGAHPDVRVVIVKGTPTAFASGADIAEFATFAGPEDGRRYEARVDRALDALESVRRPTIAALSGVVTGGGCILAAACDLRVGEPGLRVGIPVARTLGNCLTAKNAARVVALIGATKLKELIVTADLISADRALQIGFLSEVTAPGVALDDRVAELAARVATFAPRTIAATKELTRRLRDAHPPVVDDDLVASCYGSEDFREGVAAFVGKRTPQWRDR